MRQSSDFFGTLKAEEHFVHLKCTDNSRVSEPTVQRVQFVFERYFKFLSVCHLHITRLISMYFDIIAIFAIFIFVLFSSHSFLLLFFFLFSFFFFFFFLSKFILSSNFICTSSPIVCLFLKSVLFYISYSFIFQF